jgi:predicted HicB family RNase H-like nuclease
MELTGDDLMVKSPKNNSSTPQRGEAEKPTASAELVPMQFRMSPEFAKAFKVEAATRGIKLNELLKQSFAAFMKTAKQ